MSIRVLLTGGRIPSALELARALAGAQAEIFVADSYPLYLCQASRSVRRSFTVPAPKLDFAAYKEAILSIVSQYQIDLVVPCSEEVLYLARFRTELEAFCSVFCADAELLLELHHKGRFVEFSQRWKLATPASEAYHGQRLLPSFTQAPYILKKAYSRAGTGVLSAAAGSHPEAYRLPSDGSWLLQEKLQGQVLCSFSVLQEGQVLLSCIYRPSSTLGSVGVSFLAIQSPAIEAWLERFAAATGYQGFVSFDFIETDSGVQAIECNPRLTSGIHLCDPKQLAHAVLKRRKAGFLASSKPRRRAQIALAMVSALPQLLRQAAFGRRLRDILQTPDVVSSWRDPWPFFHQFLCFVYFFHRKLAGKIPLAACSMDGIEWDDDKAKQWDESEPEMLWSKVQ